MANAVLAQLAKPLASIPKLSYDCLWLCSKPPCYYTTYTVMTYCLRHSLISPIFYPNSLSHTHTHFFVSKYVAALFHFIFADAERKKPNYYYMNYSLLYYSFPTIHFGIELDINIGYGCI